MNRFDGNVIGFTPGSVIGCVAAIGSFGFRKPIALADFTQREKQLSFAGAEFADTST